MSIIPYLTPRWLVCSDTDKEGNYKLVKHVYFLAVIVICDILEFQAVKIFDSTITKLYNQILQQYTTKLLEVNCGISLVTYHANSSRYVGYVVFAVGRQAARVLIDSLNSMRPVPRILKSSFGLCGIGPQASYCWETRIYWQNKKQRARTCCNISHALLQGVVIPNLYSLNKRKG